MTAQYGLVNRCLSGGHLCLTTLSSGLHAISSRTILEDNEGVDENDYDKSNEYHSGLPSGSCTTHVAVSPILHACRLADRRGRSPGCLKLLSEVFRSLLSEDLEW